METIVKRMYEGLFLVDSGDAAADWQSMTGNIERILSRGEAEIVSLKKWDERRLAYDIGRKSRGTYILVYFNCDPSRISGIERDVQLSESIMRVMILRTDKMTPEDINRPTPAMVAETGQAAARAEAESRAAAQGPGAAATELVEAAEGAEESGQEANGEES